MSAFCRIDSSSVTDLGAMCQNVKAMLSLGGWSGSRFFSTAVSNSRSRASYIQAILNLVKTYDLDGIDFE